MLRNANGQPYKLRGSLDQFDVFNPDHALFNEYDQEIIRISGSPILYFEVMIQLNTVDELYLEDRGKLFNPNPITLYGLYEPPQQMSPSTLIGIDSPDDEILIEFNYRAVLDAVGHPPKRGSRLYTPHRGEQWILIDTKLAEFKMWSLLHVQFLCRKFQDPAGDRSVASQPQPDFTTDDVVGGTPQGLVG